MITAKSKIKVGLVLVFCLLLLGISYYNFSNQEENHFDKEVMKEYGPEKIEYIPLYYELGNDEIIYTKDSEDKFVEVKING